MGIHWVLNISKQVDDSFGSISMRFFINLAEIFVNQMNPIISAYLVPMNSYVGMFTLFNLDFLRTHIPNNDIQV